MGAAITVVVPPGQQQMYMSCTSEQGLPMVAATALVAGVATSPEQPGEPQQPVAWAASTTAACPGTVNKVHSSHEPRHGQFARFDACKLPWGSRAIPNFVTINTAVAKTRSISALNSIIFHSIVLAIPLSLKSQLQSIPLPMSVPTSL